MSNPVLNNNRFTPQDTILTGEPMTIQGTINKIFLLLACVALGAGVSIYYTFMVNASFMPALIMISSIIGFIIAIVTTFNYKLERVLD